MKFRTVAELGGKTATGLQIPDDIVAALDSGKRPSVRITIRGHVYRTTVASMRGRFMVPLSAERRAAAGVAAGEQVDVDLELDTAPREVAVPADLDNALNQDSAVRAFLDALSYTHRKEWASAPGSRTLRRFAAFPRQGSVAGLPLLTAAMTSVLGASGRVGHRSGTAQNMSSAKPLGCTPSA